MTDDKAVLDERRRCAEIARQEGLRALSRGLYVLVPEIIARAIEGRPVRDADGDYRIGDDQ